MANYIILNSNNGNMNWFSIIFHNDIDHQYANWSNVHQNIYYKIDLEGKSSEEWQTITENDSDWEELYTYFNTGEYKNTLYGYNLSIKNFAAIGDTYNEGTIDIPGNNYFTLYYDSDVSISDIYDSINGYKTEGSGASLDFDNMSAAALLKIINNLQSEISRWKNTISLDNYHWHGGDELGTYIDSLEHITESDLESTLGDYYKKDDSTSYITYDYAALTYLTIEDAGTIYATTSLLSDEINNTYNLIHDTLESSYVKKETIYSTLESSYVKKHDLNTLVEHPSLENYVTNNNLNSRIETLQAGFIQRQELENYVPKPEEGVTYVKSTDLAAISSSIQSLSATVDSNVSSIQSINTTIESLVDPEGEINFDEYVKHVDAAVSYLSLDEAESSYLKKADAELLYAPITTLKYASAVTAGVIKVDPDITEISIDENGFLSIDTQKLDLADFNTSTKGIVYYSSDTVKVEEGRINVLTENLLKTSETTYGVTKIDNNTININSSGQIFIATENLDKADSTTYGIVKIDNDTIKIDENGKLYVDGTTISGGGSGPSEPGDIPSMSDYYKKVDIDRPDGILKNYVAKDDPTSYITYDYAAISYLTLTEAESSYLKKSDAQGLYAPKATDENPYITKNTLQNTLQPANVADRYVKNSDLGTIYCTNEKLTKTLNDTDNGGANPYLRKSNLTSELSNYYTQQDIIDNYYSKGDIDIEITRIDTALASAGLDTSILETYWKTVEGQRWVGDYIHGELQNYAKLDNLPNTDLYFTKVGTNDKIWENVYTYYDTIILDRHYTKTETDTNIRNSYLITTAWVENEFPNNVELHALSYVTHEWLEAAISSLCDGTGGTKEGDPGYPQGGLGHNDRYGHDALNSIANKSYVSSYLNEYAREEWGVNDTDKNLIPRIGWVKSYTNAHSIHDRYGDLDLPRYDDLTSSLWVQSYVSTYVNKYLDNVFDGNETNTNIPTLNYVKTYVNTYNEKRAFTGGNITASNTDLASLHWVASYTASYVHTYATANSTSINTFSENDITNANKYKLTRVDWVGSYVNSYITRYADTINVLYSNTDLNSSNKYKLPRNEWVASYVNTYINTYSITPNELYTDNHLTATNRDKLARLQWVGSYINTYTSNFVSQKFNGTSDEFTGQNKNKIPTTYWVAGYVFSSVSAMNQTAIANEITSRLSQYVSHHDAGLTYATKSEYVSKEYAANTYVTIPTGTTYVTHLETSTYATKGEVNTLSQNLSSQLNAFIIKANLNDVINKVNEIIQAINNTATPLSSQIIPLSTLS